MIGGPYLDAFISVYHKPLPTYSATNLFHNCSGNGKIQCELTHEELRALRVLNEDTFVDQFF